MRRRRAGARQQHHVARLPVAMHDALAMCLVERVADLDADRERKIDRKGSTGEPRGQRVAFEILQDEIWGAVLVPHVVQRADVRVVELRDGARLAVEALPELRVGGDVRRQHLDGDGAIQPRIARAIHFAHAARPERGDDLVGTNSTADSETHGARISDGPSRVPTGRTMVVPAPASRGQAECGHDVLRAESRAFVGFPRDGAPRL
jgi:hypothetical protein